MGFSGKMNQPCDLKSLKDIFNDPLFPNISFYEMIPIRIVFGYVPEIGQVAGIGEVVKIDDSYVFSIL